MEKKKELVLSKEPTDQLGPSMYVIKERLNVIVLMLIAGFFLTLFASLGYLVFNARNVEITYLGQELDIPILVFGIIGLFVLVFGLYILFFSRKKQMTLYQHGLTLNDERIMYADISHIDIKRLTSYKIIIHTDQKKFVYQSFTFNRYDQYAFNQVYALTKSN